MMNKIKYFFQFIAIFFLLILFKIIGLKYSRFLAGKIFCLIGPIFRSKNIIEKNISIAFPKIDFNSKKKIIDGMWTSYGKIFAEYMFIKKIRSEKTNKYIEIEGLSELDKLISSKKPVIFISGHFDNFELMAMAIEKAGINLAAIYRPLNNQFLNPLMEKIRKKYICKNQIKKGFSGTKETLKYFKEGASIALMIDQRVSEGIKCDFFGKEALTTTIPAQFVKKFNCKVVPIHIERKQNDKFKCMIHEPLTFKENDTHESISLKLNKTLENMILINPKQWIWTHNRWK